MTEQQECKPHYSGIEGGHENRSKNVNKHVLPFEPFHVQMNSRIVLAEFWHGFVNYNYLSLNCHHGYLHKMITIIESDKLQLH